MCISGPLFEVAGVNLKCVNIYVAIYHLNSTGCVIRCGEQSQCRYAQYMVHGKVCLLADGTCSLTQTTDLVVVYKKKEGNLTFKYHITGAWEFFLMLSIVGGP